MCPLPLLDETVILTTLPGAEDLLLDELHTNTSISEHRQSKGRITARVASLTDLGDLQRCRLFSRAAIPLPSEPTTFDSLQALHRSGQHGLIGVLRGSDRIRFRVGAATEPRIKIIRDLEDALGWTNDPTDWMINITGGNRASSDPPWVAELGPLFWTQRFGSFKRLPWSTNPLVAEILVRLAKIRAGQRILDPCCGTGTILVAAGHALCLDQIDGLHHFPADDQLSGSDLDETALSLARLNLARCQVPARVRIGSAAALQSDDRTVDRVIANLPFGRQSGSHAENTQLYPAVLKEITRILTGNGRAVLLTDDKRLFRSAVAGTKGIKIIRERTLSYGGVTPTAFVLARTRG